MRPTYETALAALLSEQIDMAESQPDPARVWPLSAIRVVADMFAKSEHEVHNDFARKLEGR